jgi:hypothetical protein
MDSFAIITFPLRFSDTFMTHREQLVFDHLAQFVSDHKKEFVDKVLDARTRNITVVQITASTPGS